MEVDLRTDVFAVFGNGDESAAPAHVAASTLVREGLHHHLQVLVNGGCVVAAAEGDTQPVEALAHAPELGAHAGEVDSQAVAGELHVLDVGDVEVQAKESSSITTVCAVSPVRWYLPPTRCLAIEEHLFTEPIRDTDTRCEYGADGSGRAAGSPNQQIRPLC